MPKPIMHLFRVPYSLPAGEKKSGEEKEKVQVRCMKIHIIKTHLPAWFEWFIWINLMSPSEHMCLHQTQQGCG